MLPGQRLCLAGVHGVVTLHTPYHIIAAARPLIGMPAIGKNRLEIGRTARARYLMPPGQITRGWHRVLLYALLLPQQGRHESQ